ncbi:MAG: hypothetical protein KBS76_06245 [Ruminococcus sp.]|nr:hypothetical protein [Candidatus Apopatosoma intestinale]
MNVRELFESVKALGFGSEPEDTDGFYHTANRALRELALLRPIRRVFEIDCHAVKNEIGGDDFRPVRVTEELSYEAVAPKAYFFEAGGKGTAAVEKRDAGSGAWQTVKTIPVDCRDLTPFRGFVRENGTFLSGAVRLRFVGSPMLTVRGAAFYTDVWNENEEDIPSSAPLVRYDLLALAPDFAGTDDDPFPDGAPEGTRVENGREVLVPRTWDGILAVRYRHAPDPLPLTDRPWDDEREIDLDAETATLLPLLVASYVLADDEREKANAYRTLYEARREELMRDRFSFEGAPMKDRYGW